MYILHVLIILGFLKFFSHIILRATYIVLVVINKQLTFTKIVAGFLEKDDLYSIKRAEQLIGLAL